jgi:probable phosphoglycerate mutase
LSGAPPAGVRTVPLAVEGATRLVLVRHGEAVCNVSGVIGGRKGCTGLTETGVAQVEALRDRLWRSGELREVAALYASVLPRAIETAGILAPALEAWRDGPPLAIATDCSVCELHPGESDGLNWGEFLERFGEPKWDVDPTQPLAPEGESWTEFLDRAAAGLSLIAAAHPGELVVVACHAGVIESAMSAFLPFEHGPQRRGWLRTNHASMTEFELGDRGWVLRRYNDSTPLQQA